MRGSDFSRCYGRYDDRKVLIVGLTDILGDAVDLLPLPPPIQDAVDSVSSLVDVVRAVDQGGVDVLWNAAADMGEAASVVEFFLPKAKQTPVISAGLKIIQGLQFACGGNNKVNNGEEHTKGYQMFNEIADALAKPVPNKTWTGSASDAYGYANEQQRLRAKQMVDADIAIHGAVAAEANKVRSVRQMLNEGATVLGNTILPAIAAQSIPRYGKALSYSIQMGVFSSAVPTAIWRMEELKDLSDRVSESITSATRIYEEVARGCANINL
jgi:hypothetical protein